MGGPTRAILSTGEGLPADDFVDGSTSDDRIGEAADREAE